MPAPADTHNHTPISPTELFDTVREWSPRTTIRIDPHGDHRYVAARLPATAPDVPWALHLADRNSQFHVLCMDFDDRPGKTPGAARKAAEQVSRMLTRAEIPHLLCASGGRHSRHLWIRLTAPADAKRVRRLAEALTRHCGTVFDATPLLNPGSGCARAPGSPHRHGGHSQILRTAGRPATEALAWATDGADPTVIETLTAWAGGDTAANPGVNTHPHSVTLTKALRVIDHDRGVIPGTKRALPDRIRQLAHATPAAGADTSRTAWSVMLSAAHAHWTLDDITTAALTTRMPGLEHLRTTRADTGRTPRTDPTEHIAHQWDRALAVAAAAPPATTDTDAHSHARSHVRAALTAAERDGFFRGSAQAFRRWAALSVIADMMYRADTVTDFELDIRRWAVAAATTKSVLAATVRELMDTGWLIRTRPHSGTRAAAYRLCIPTLQVDGHKDSHPPEPPLGNALDRARSYLTHLTRDVWQHPVLGPAAARLHWMLREHPGTSRARLRHATGLSIGEFDTTMEALHRHRLIHQDVAVDRERIYHGVAAFLGVHGTLERRRTRYRHESMVWAWWCAEIAWRTAAAGSKPSSAARDLYGRFPTFADGRCDWATAMHRVAAVDARRTTR
ncbi:hypothetical protein [Prescottella subtropica]|uniref:hypothetical protein n=1 Tax=Prescottella subtropica TaxID=2545757 RepID=UPI0010F96FA6|nr:hypothetical protein [Prescottella subtropica]